MSTITAYVAGATDKQVYLIGYTASTGAPYTAGAYNTAGITIEYRRQGANAAVAITPATQTVNGAHSDGGFVHISGGRYRLDIPDAVIATGADYAEVWVYGITDTVFTTAHIDIMGADPRAATVDASAATSAVTSSATAASTAASVALSTVTLRPTSAQLSAAESTSLSSIALRATSANVSGSVSTAQSATLSTHTAASTARSVNLSTVTLRPTSAQLSTAESTSLSSIALTATSANVSTAESRLQSSVGLTPSQVMSVALSSNGIAANAKRMNDATITGDGTSGTPWTGAA